LHGLCDKKFEPVKAHLEHMLRKGCEDNVQLCVYVDNKCVIDLYGTAVGNHKYNADSIQVINLGFVLKVSEIKKKN
jgi:putative heme degradation protein